MTATQDTRFDGVREQIRAGLTEGALPSLAVAVAHKGEIVWEEAFGWADREKRIPATPHTLYSLASISKPITATGLMILQERGKLDLDAPLDTYLGEAKLQARVGKAADATVRRVANHTSGLPLHYQFFYADESYRRPPMDETIRRYGNLVTLPGEKYQYSNLGYGLLDDILARISGKSYADFMRQEVFLPLGMTRSSVDIAPGLEPYQAVRYGADGVPFPFYDFDHPGGSAVFCSAHDLLRFGMFHLKTSLPDQKAILKPETLDAMREPTATHPGGTTGYGVGWASDTEPMGYRGYGHSGGMGGVNTLLAFIPEEELAVVTLANASCSLPYNIANEIRAALVPAFAEKWAQKKAQEPQQKEEEPPFRPSGALTGEWQGSVQTYREEIPLTLRILRSGDVHVQLGLKLRTLLNDVRFKEGYLTGKMQGDIRTEDANRRPYRLHLELKLRGRDLNGPVMAITHLEGDSGGAPGRRIGNALSSWGALKRVRG